MCWYRFSGIKLTDALRHSVGVGYSTLPAIQTSLTWSLEVLCAKENSFSIEIKEEVKTRVRICSLGVLSQDLQSFSRTAPVSL